MRNNKRFLVLLFITLTLGLREVVAQLPSQKAAIEIDKRVANEVKSDSLLMEYFTLQNIPITTNNDVTLLISGDLKFKDLFKYIEEAKHHIHLEYFNFRNDSIANTLFDLLAKKAKEGVEVRALFDAFGNWSNNQPLQKKHLEAIRARGIEIVEFDPIRFPWINHVFMRDHRKIVIIDGSIGYTGGMNIADYYINGLPEIGDWRDMHMRIEGNAVSDLQDIFLAIWNKTTKQAIEGDAYYPLRMPDNAYTQGEKTIAIVDRIPQKTPKIMRKAYIQSLNAAEHKVQIINPYFTPTISVKKAIRKALKRGVEIEIMVPSKSDIPFTPAAALYTANKLREKGAEIYMFNGGFHHAKIMMVDSVFCTVGSTNLNSRSLRYDYEVNAFIFNAETTQELITIFEEDKLDSTLLTEEGYNKEGVWRRFGRWFAYLFTPFL
ncbi:MAG: cardiolipin synthase [Phocaeicola sp.]